MPGVFSFFSSSSSSSYHQPWYAPSRISLLPPQPKFTYKVLHTGGPLETRLLQGVTAAPRSLMRKVITVVVFGETGCGKSTLLDAMANYVFGVRLNDHFRYKLVDPASEGNGSSSQVVSQTKNTTEYWLLLDSRNSTWLRLVDTPGFADTSGMEVMKQNTADIESFLSRMDSIDAVCFVAPAGKPRLTATQKYLVEQCLRLFAKDAIDNLFLLATFADNGPALVVDAMRAANFPVNKCIKFNNSALFSPDRSSRFTIEYWKMCMGGLRAFFDTIAQLTPFSMRLSKEVLRQRRDIQCHLDYLHGKMREMLDIMSNCKENEKNIKLFEADINLGKDFEIIEHKTRREHRELPPGVKNTTWCSLCDSTCHDNCGIPDNADKSRCVAMDANGNCKHCAAKCGWTAHKNVPYIVANVPYTEKTINQERFDVNNKGMEGKTRAQRLLARFQQEYRTAFQEAQRCVVQMKMCIDRLKDIGIIVRVESEADYIRMLIDSEEEKKEVGWHERVKSLKDMYGKADLMGMIERGEALPVDAELSGIFFCVFQYAVMALCQPTHGNNGCAVFTHADMVIGCDLL